jgi:hypothetical protein
MMGASVEAINDCRPGTARALDDAAIRPAAVAAIGLLWAAPVCPAV